MEYRAVQPGWTLPSALAQEATRLGRRRQGYGNAKAARMAQPKRPCAGWRMRVARTRCAHVEA
eukprot:13395565-Alexandrium_andersonii.AAC.1